ncbi:hypothetical protein V5O48_019387, partial [Marasmius crinis-equi]
CTGMMVTQKALQFMNDEVSSPHRARLSWTFEDVIIGLFDHCVASTTIHQAAKQFDNVKYDPKKGIKDYFATLSRWAYRMPNQPDRYTFKRRFVDGLPKRVIREMIRLGTVPDYANVKTMIKAVQRFEDDLALQDYYLEGKTDENVSKSQSSRNDAMKNHNPSTGRPEKARIINGRRYKLVRKVYPSQQHDGRFATNVTTSTTKATFGSTPQKSYPPKGGSSSKPEGSKPSGTTPICYGCGKPGHYANDPK